MQRRGFLVSAALVPGLGLVPGVAGAAAPAPHGAHGAVIPTALDPVLASAGTLGTKAPLAGGFQVAQGYEVFHGAMPFVLEGEGERFQLDMLRRVEGGETGIHATEHFVFFVHGAGGAAQERGARALGLAVEQELREGAPMPLLASFEERHEQESGERFHVDFVATAELPSV